MSYKFDTPPPSPQKKRTESGPRNDPSKVSRTFISKPNPDKDRKGDIVSFFLYEPLDDSESRGYKTNGHFRASVNRWQPCKNCTERTPNGDACPHVQTGIAQLVAKGLTPGKAWGQSRASTMTYFPGFAWKASQATPDNQRLIGSTAVEMDQSLAKLFGEQIRVVAKTCATCGTEESMRHVDFRCKTCSNEVTWVDEDRAHDVNPTCATCKGRVEVTETLLCAEADCGGKTAQDPTQGLWKIWSKRLVDEKGVASNVWTIKFFAKKTPTKEVTEGARVTMRSLIEYCSDFEVVAPDPALEEQKQAVIADAHKRQLASHEDIPW